MSARRAWLIVIVVAVIAIAALVWWWAAASSVETDRSGSGGDESAEHAEHAKSDDHDHDHVHAVEETGPEVWRETSEDGEYLDIADTPARFVEQGAELASAWVTFDSGDG